MAVVRHDIPDDFQKPEERPAAEKSTVNAVLTRLAIGGGNFLSLLFGLLAAVLILYSGYILYDSVYTENAAVSAPFDLLKYRPEIIEEGATPKEGGEVLSEINNDYRGWLIMYGSSIDYPFVQGENDLYYANHDIYKNASLTGSVYLSSGSARDLTDSYNVIYGHHMDNGAMFGSLDKYLDENFFASNREGLIVSENGVFDLHTFAIITTDAYESQVYHVGNRAEEVIRFLTERNASPDAKTNVVRFDESALHGNDQIVALSTCMDANTNGRVVLFATMERRNLIELTAEGYEGVFDNETHRPSVSVNYPNDTVYSYSTDGGVTFVDGIPEVHDVGTGTYILRVENPYYGVSEKEITLSVLPKEITIKVSDQFKVYGEPDPEWETEEIEGIIDGFVPDFTIVRTNASVEETGTYEDVLVVEGDEYQGNYHFTFEPGDLTITNANTLVMLTNGYSGVYDGEAHSLSRVEVNVTEGTTIEYSVDGGVTWQSDPPAITNVGTMNVVVRATNPNYDPVVSTVSLTVTPKTVTIHADDATKKQGEDDPEFTATVTGLLDETELIYSVTRPNKGTDEKQGVYENALVAMGVEYQGNYHLVFESGRFTITKPDTEIIDDPTIPISDFIDRFTPSPVSGTPAWALVNLIVLIITLYIFLPLLRLRDKYGRAKTMKRINSETEEMSDMEESVKEAKQAAKNEALGLPSENPEDGDEKRQEDDEDNEDVYNVRKFRRRFYIGLALEIIISVLGVVVFILTENLKLPMVLIDKWTPIMILIMAAILVTDMICFRKMKKNEEDEEKEEDKPKKDDVSPAEAQ